MPSNAAILTRLIIRDRPSLLVRLRRRFGSDVLAEEVIQGLWFKIRGVSEDMPILHPRAYLHRLATNLAVDHVRRERNNAAIFEAVDIDLQTPCDRPSPERVLLGRDALARIMEALDELPPRCRQVMRMRRIEGCDVGEIASVMGISRQMVWRYMNQGMDHISARIRETD